VVKGKNCFLDEGTRGILLAVKLMNINLWNAKYKGDDRSDSATVQSCHGMDSNQGSFI